MSLFCYDFEKWTIISMLSVAMSLFGLVSLAYGQSDFILEAHRSHEPSDLAWEVTKFMISGESDKEICPSGQCSISTGGKPLVYPPNPERMFLSYDMDFLLKDNMTYADIGPKKKEFLERFNSYMYTCKIDDIIEKNGEEVYYCNGHNTINRKLDSKTWNYDTIGIYDAKNYVVKVYGNFTGAD